MTSAAWRLWWLPLRVAALCAVLQFVAPAISEWLRLQPDMIRDGQVWRLLTGHLLHLSWGHYLMNAAALLAICGIFAAWLKPWTLAWWMFASACSVGLGLLWFDPRLSWYVGLSGVLHGVLVAGSLRETLERGPLERRCLGLTILIATVVKLIWEQNYSPLLGSEAATGGKVIVDAHLYGALGGVAALGGQALTARWTSRRRGAFRSV